MPSSTSAGLFVCVLSALVAAILASSVPEYATPVYTPRPTIHGVSHFGPARGDVQVVLTDNGVWFSKFGFVPVPQDIVIPPQGKPVTFMPTINELGFYFIVTQTLPGSSVPNVYVWSGNAATGQLYQQIAMPRTTSCRPDKFGFYRNCLVSTINGVYFAGPLKGIPLQYSIHLAAGWQSTNITTYMVPTGIGASDFVTFTENIVTGIAFVSWSALGSNDLYLLNVTTGDPTPLGPPLTNVNATYLQGAPLTPPYLFFQTLRDYDMISNTLVRSVYGIYDFVTGPTFVRGATIEIAKEEMVEMFLPFQFALIGDYMLFSNWGPPGSAPEIELVTVRPAINAGAPDASVQGASLGWFMSLALDDFTVVGPSTYAATADDFVNARSFESYRFNAATLSFERLGQTSTHIFTAFTLPFRSYNLWAQQGSATAPPSFASVRDYSGPLNPLTVGATQVLCPGRETWLHYARIQPTDNGTHAFFYAPGDNGPAIFVQSASGGKTLLFSPAEPNTFHSSFPVATRNSSIIIARESQDTYQLVSHDGNSEQAILFEFGTPASVARCIDFDIRGPTPEFPTRRLVQPSIVPVWMRSVASYTAALLIDSAGVLGSLIAQASTPIENVDVPQYPDFPLYFDQIWFRTLDTVGGTSRIFSLSGTNFTTTNGPLNFQPVQSDLADPLLFWVRSTSEIWYSSGSSSPIAVLTGGTGTSIPATFSGRNSVIAGSKFFAPVSDTGDGGVLVEASPYVIHPASPSSIVPDSTLLPGSNLILISLRDQSGTRVLAGYDASGPVSVNWIDIFSADDAVTHFASFDRVIIFQIHFKTDQLVRVYIFNERTSSFNNPLTLNVAGCPVVQASATIVNNLVAIRWAHGDVALCNSSFCRQLDGFAPLTAFAKSKKLIWSTQGSNGRLFFSHVDRSMRESVFTSPPLPCVTNTDCAMGQADFICLPRGFCGLPPAPSSPPPASNVSAPLAPIPPFAVAPLSGPVGSSASPISVCVPPAPTNSVCTPSGWVINVTVVVSPGGTVVINSPTTINGNLSVASGSTLNIAVQSGGSPPLVVNGCVQFGGSLNVSLPGSTVSATNVELIRFNGYCSGTQTQFSSFALNLGCAKLRPGANAPLQYSQTSLSLIFAAQDVDSTDCNGSVSGGLSTGAIAGIAVGAAALVLIIVFVIIWINRERIIPYYKSRADMRKKKSSLNQHL